MPRPLTPEERTEIERLLNEGKPYREIAATIGRSHGAIGRIAKTIGHRPGHTNAARAREARAKYSAERRAMAGAMAGDRLEELLGAFLDVQPVVVSTPKGPKVLEVAPDARALRDRAAAVQTLMKTILDVDRHDNRAEEGMSVVMEWVHHMRGDEE